MSDCRRGHEMEGNRAPDRSCRICKLDGQRRRRAAKKAVR